MERDGLDIFGDNVGMIGLLQLIVRWIGLKKNWIDLLEKEKQLHFINHISDLMMVNDG
jgi:putative heme degradation protein